MALIPTGVYSSPQAALVIKVSCKPCLGKHTTGCYDSTIFSSTSARWASSGSGPPIQSQFYLCSFSFRFIILPCSFQHPPYQTSRAIVQIILSDEIYSQDKILIKSFNSKYIIFYFLSHQIKPHLNLFPLSNLIIASRGKACPRHAFSLQNNCFLHSSVCWCTHTGDNIMGIV